MQSYTTTVTLICGRIGLKMIRYKLKDALSSVLNDVK